MKKTMTLLALAAISLAGFTGCAGDKQHEEQVNAKASSTRLSYDDLLSRINKNLGKLQAVENDSGTPSQYRSVVRDVESDLKSLISCADDTACDLRDTNESRIAHIRADAAEHSNNTVTGSAASRALGVDAASRQAARVEKLRDYQNTFAEDASKLRLNLEKARGNLVDLDSSLTSNLVLETVRLTKGSLSNAISALKDAKGNITDLQNDITKIRDYQPQSIDR